MTRIGNTRDKRILDGVAGLKLVISVVLASFSLLPGKSWPMYFSLAS